jgi:3-ketosteroid 9alpha-monooxygenase subunit A
MEESNRHGWYQVAFISELLEGTNAARIGKRRFVLLKSGDEVRCFDADCPHRGAHLGCGGKLAGNTIICPFHGYAIHIGTAADLDRTTPRFQVREYETLSYSGLVFLNLSDVRSNNLRESLNELAEDFVVVPAFHLRARVDPEIVIENAFDRLHFAAVHGMKTDTFDVQETAAGTLQVLSIFYVPQRSGEDRNKFNVAPISYLATAFSPGLVLVQLGGDAPYAAITGATYAEDGVTDIRLSFVFPRATYGDAPNPTSYEQLLRFSEAGLELDKQIWENLAPNTPAWTHDDDPIHVFRRYCEGFC